MPFEAGRVEGPARVVADRPFRPLAAIDTDGDKWASLPDSFRLMQADPSTSRHLVTYQLLHFPRTRWHSVCNYTPGPGHIEARQS